MRVVYRYGTLGYYMECLSAEKYRWWIGPYAWQGNWPSESCWAVPGTLED